jgi:hypothetical protein
VGSFRIQKNKNRNTIAIYCVESIKDLAKVIIPHFDKYPLITQKRADFELFKKIVLMMNNKEHLNMEGLKEIISIRASLNKGLTPLLKKHFPEVIPCERPKVEIPKTFDPFWIQGFVEGEGCFYIKIANLATTKKAIVSLRFYISQHSRDRLLLNSLIQYLGSGRLEETPIIARLVITKFEDIQQIVLPFFAKYPLIGVKKQDFEEWSKVAELMKNNVHLTKEGIDEIHSIKLGMNTGRDSGDLSSSDSLSISSDSDNTPCLISDKLTKRSKQEKVLESETSSSSRSG